MKPIFGILVILVICFTSCDNRKTVQQSLAESIEKFKKNVDFETNVYIPETYLEREVDTLMSNDFRVTIKTYSDMMNSVRFSKIKDTINHQTHYRNFKFDITVTRNEEELYNQSFNKQSVNEAFQFKANLPHDSSLYNFDTLAVLKSIQVNQESSESDRVGIDIMYGVPETDRYALYRLNIDEDGQSNIIQVEVK
ncbi:hypothetical protein DFQ11_102437 [Winogradskyella epiphytica]|uniref:Uncharacterized protein n=1 Tax=Winogradskyella epiphytica TaxID=262005 RepID=A0A2V4X8D5_9FLAO|nr:hypothetical protein [Winogradskyella epiphytica]PYE81859.1 hypothetical protein DFQ11_102437 [Winogradskyella epiphytica]GGW62144.1 hypothetical protein GCM10008085_12340 [Winogradskyella epiphytica]